MDPMTFAVVGSGWRAEFFVRMARLAPERFRCTGVTARSAQRAAWIERAWGVPVARSVEELVTGAHGAGTDRPALVVTATPWDVTPDVVCEVVAAGVPVLAETPPASDAAGLVELWDQVGATGLVQVAEHSPFMPAHAARRAVLAAGLIGEPTSVQLSSTHGYHAVGLIRWLLGVAPGEVTVRASSFTAPLVDPVDRTGWTGAHDPVPAATVLATLDLGAGRSALYDFTENQWHNPLRTNRIVVRGSRGEICGDTVTHLADDRTVLDTPIVRRRSGVEQNLDGFDTELFSLGERVLWRNAFLGTRLADDDLAVAGLLAACAAWLRGEAPAPYPLAQGCHDQLVSLAIDEAVRTGAPVVVRSSRWADGPA